MLGAWLWARYVSFAYAYLLPELSPVAMANSASHPDPTSSQLPQVAYHLENCGCHRRWFLKAGLAGAAAFPFLGKTPPAQAETHQAEALILSCIDFRMMEVEQQFLAQQQLSHRYDWVALAGASLALAGFPHAAEAETFWDQLEISQHLHHINRVIILDHQDCGAYASKVGPTLSQDPQQEQQVHATYLNQAYWAITAKYPDLRVELYFLGLDGTVYPVSPTMAQ